MRKIRAGAPPPKANRALRGRFHAAHFAWGHLAERVLRGRNERSEVIEVVAFRFQYDDAQVQTAHVLLFVEEYTHGTSG